MELNAFWGSLLRRWPLVIGAVVLSMAAVALCLARVSPAYTAEGTVLVFPPTTSTVVNGERQTPGNPFLELGGLTPVRDLLIRTMTAKAFQMEMAEKFPGAGFEVTSDFATDGPLLVVGVSAPSQQEAVGALDAITARVPALLKTLQSGANFPKHAGRVTSMDLTKDTVATRDTTGAVRTSIMAGGAVLTIMLLAIGLVDGLLRRRGGDPAAQGFEEAAAPDEPDAPAERIGIVSRIRDA